MSLIISGLISHAEGYTGILVTMIDGTTATISFDENPVIKLQPEKLVVQTDIATTEFDRSAVARFTYLSDLPNEEITNAQEVDLGLPSGTIWAGWNVGASSPEEYGGYYAWGETEEKSDYDWDTYKHWIDNDEDGFVDAGEFANIGTNISGTQYDVARQKWGGSWRMPTKAEFDELISKCTSIRSQYKNIFGYKITGPNSNSIFLPIAGYYSGSLYNDNYGGYWSSTSGMNGNNQYVCYLGFGEEIYGNYNGYQFCQGFTVRPVKTGEGNSVEKTLQNDVEIINIGSVLLFSNLPTDSEIKLYAIDGKLLQNEVATGNYNINITNLPSGIYIVNVNGISTKIAK